MRPLFSFAHIVGLVMLGYAAGVMVTPHSGVTNWLTVNTFHHPAPDWRRRSRAAASIS